MDDSILGLGNLVGHGSRFNPQVVLSRTFCTQVLTAGNLNGEFRVLFANFSPNDVALLDEIPFFEVEDFDDTRFLSGYRLLADNPKLGMTHRIAINGRTR